MAKLFLVSKYFFSYLKIHRLLSNRETEKKAIQSVPEYNCYRRHCIYYV